jgi:hypothetical protein
MIINNNENNINNKNCKTNTHTNLVKLKITDKQCMYSVILWRVHVTSNGLHCIFKLQITLNNSKIFIVAQKLFMANLCRWQLLRFSWNVSESFVKRVRKFREKCPKVSWNGPKFSWKVSESFVKSVRKFRETCPKFSWNVSESFVKRVRKFCETCPKVLWKVSESFVKRVRI